MTQEDKDTENWIKVQGYNEFSNITLASKQTGISRTAIADNISGRSMSAGGYIWKYKNR